MEEKIEEVLLQENRNLQILQKSLAGALKDVFGEYTESQRFLDLKRVPLICKDVSNLLKNQEAEKRERESFRTETQKLLFEHRQELNNNLQGLRTVIEKGDGDHETRLRNLETFKNQVDGKADKNSVWLAYVVSVIGMIVGIILHFWK